MARVTGIGGVFFRVRDPAATVAWYRDHLGLEPEPDFPCVAVRWSGGEQTVWAPFDQDTDYFGDRSQPVMINYRVDDLDAMIQQLQDAGVEVFDRRDIEPNGRFAWAIDCDGNRIEIWEPAPGE